MHATVAEAKARLAEFIRRAEGGEEIVLTRHGRPVARLSPAAETAKGPLIGALAGQISIADDFDDLPPEFMAAFQDAS
ncbi:MAG: type II toxin-antitoxin system prevent-host-death family antitoxin [Pseudomonadota bacterium]